MGIQKTMKAVGDPTRREILNLLKEKPITAGEICNEFNMTGATISHHLSILKDVIDEKKGKYIYYELSTSVLEEIFTWFENLRGEKNENK